MLGRISYLHQTLQLFFFPLRQKILGKCRTLSLPTLNMALSFQIQFIMVKPRDKDIYILEEYIDFQCHLYQAYQCQCKN
jgi:hypothetical protein